MPHERMLSINACLVNPHLRLFLCFFAHRIRLSQILTLLACQAKTPLALKPTPGFRVRDAYRIIQSKGFSV